MDMQKKRWSKIVCLNFIGNPLLSEQFGGFEKAEQTRAQAFKYSCHSEQVPEIVS